jgi:hypothetical protein
MAYRHTATFYFRRAVLGDVCDRPHLPPRGSVFTVTSLQPLPVLPPEGRSSREVPSFGDNRSRFFTIIFLRSVGPKVPRVFNAPIFTAATLCAASSFVSVGADPSTMSWRSFPQSNGSPADSLCDLQTYGLPEDPAECCPAYQTWLLSPAPSSSSGVAAG